MRRRGIAVALGLIAVALLALFNVAWSVLVVLTAVLVWMLIYVTAPKRKAVALVGLAAIGLIMWRIGAAPAHLGALSGASTRLPWIGTVITPPPEAYAQATESPQLDEMDQFKEDFRREVFRLGAQANAVELALDLKGAADRALDFARDAKVESGDLLDAKASFGQALERRKLDDLKSLDETKATLQSFLAEFQKRMAVVANAKEMARLLVDFRLQSRQKGIDDVNDSMRRLEESLNRIARDVIGAELKVEAYNRIRVLEKKDALLREELIVFATRNVALRAIDATELMLVTDPDAAAQELLVFFGDNEAGAEKPSDIRRIPIRRGVTKVTLVKRTVVPAKIARLSTPLRLYPFSYVLLRWPTSFAPKLRLTLDLTSANLSDAYPYSIEASTNAPISELWIPAYSLFNASIAFKNQIRFGEEHILTPDPALMPAYFLTHNHVWLELVPDSILFRNKLVQDQKEYLFPENWVGALCVMAAGAVIALIFGLSLRGKESKRN
jgi:hypothetical protein